MIKIASSLEKRAHRIPWRSEANTGAEYFRSDFMIPEGTEGSLPREQRTELFERYKNRFQIPHAFIVEEQSGGSIPSHFHRVAQFQVVTDGYGTLGRHPVRSFAVHYTDPFTGYGPVTPGAGTTLSYYTLRAQFDPGANYLTVPGVRSLLQPSRKRYLLVDADTVGVSDASTLRARTQNAVDILIPETDDGLGAYLMRIAPGASATGPNPADCGGQYYVVVNGELLLDGAALPFLSCMFITSDEPPLRISAGQSGLEALVLQFPRPNVIS